VRPLLGATQPVESGMKPAHKNKCLLTVSARY
jgi:hypothetical protein